MKLYFYFQKSFKRQQTWKNQVRILKEILIYLKGIGIALLKFNKFKYNIIGIVNSGQAI